MDVLGVWNAALTQAGGRQLLASTADVSLAGDLLRLWYVPSRDYVFRKAAWPSLRYVTTLALVAENDFVDDWTPADPPLPWRYAYARPANMLAARWLQSAKVDAGKISSVREYDFAFSRMGDAKVILTNVESAVLTYSKPVENPEDWDDDLLQAVIFHLAGNLTMPLSGQAPLQRSNFAVASEYIRMALETQANADHQYVPEATSEMIESRGVYYPPHYGGKREDA